MPRTLTEAAHDVVAEVQRNPVRALDGFFFFLAAVAAAWLAFLLLHQFITDGWRHLWTFIPFWLLITYFLLPRIHRLLTRLYVPDYFIGRSRTREGLLGDPINVGLRGTEEQIHQAMINAGWHRADELNLRSGLGIVTATLLRRSYPDAPVSPLYLFGRRMAFTYQQEVEGNPKKRHHVRFWPCPPGWRLPGGRKVDWLAAGTYDTAVGLNWFTLQVTHRIDAEVDAERDHILATLTAPGAGNAGIGVRWLRNFSSGYHHRNGGGDRIRTDGDLPIVDLRDSADPSPQMQARIAAEQKEAMSPRAVPLTVAFVLATIAARVAVGVWSLVQAMRTGEAEVIYQDVLAPLLPWDWTTRNVLWLVGAFLLAYLVLGVLVALRHNWARIVVLVMSAASVIGWAALWLTGAPEQALALNLFGNAVEILVLITLSGSTARVYTLGSRRKQGEPALT